MARYADIKPGRRVHVLHLTDKGFQAKEFTVLSKDSKRVLLEDLNGERVPLKRAIVETSKVQLVAEV
jgi:hypothetical protein